VEYAALVTKSILPSAELKEVLGGLGGHIFTKFEYDSPGWFITNLHIKKYCRVDEVA